MNETKVFQPTFARVVSHARAMTALQRFINSHFGNTGEHARFSIPVQPDDDDIVIMDYIAQRAALPETPR